MPFSSDHHHLSSKPSVFSSLHYMWFFTPSLELNLPLAAHNLMFRLSLPIYTPPKPLDQLRLKEQLLIISMSLSHQQVILLCFTYSMAFLPQVPHMCSPCSSSYYSWLYGVNKSHSLTSIAKHCSTHQFLATCLIVLAIKILLLIIIFLHLHILWTTPNTFTNLPIINCSKLCNYKLTTFFIFSS